MQPNHDLLIHIETADGVSLLQAEGELSVRTAAHLRDVLLGNLREGEKLVLNAAGLDSVDLCGLQLICSAHNTYRACNAVLEMTDLPASVRETARAAGFDPSVCSCPHPRSPNCIWRP